MTKKHFEALAAAVKAEYWREDHEDAVRAAEMIANVCAQFSPRFDRARFLKACGVEG